MPQSDVQLIDSYRISGLEGAEGGFGEGILSWHAVLRTVERGAASRRRALLGNCAYRPQSRGIGPVLACIGTVL